ncbi:MAG: ABC transporter permease [Deltaproteobacteria bacterium]|nr:ABC transporter permease [Deltaproteobacteria bacterium]
MRAYLIKRILLAIPTILGVATLVFFLQALVPGDVVDFMLGERAIPADREALRREMGLDRPLTEQYFRFLLGDLRYSYIQHRPVLEMVIERYPATLELAMGGMLVAVVVAFPLGIASAVRRNTTVDHVSRLGALLGLSMPNFWIGPMLIIFFSIYLDILPVSGRGGLSHLVLPSVTLGTAMAAILTRMIRSSLLEVMGEEYIITARSKGLRESVLLFKHALRNALVPVVTIMGLQLGRLLGGSVITETIFSWPGVGRLMITAITTRDIPLLQGCVYVLIDPRIRLR